jgi:hypothetical protein
MCDKWPRIYHTCRKHYVVISSFMTYPRVCSKGNTTGATYGAATAYLPEHLRSCSGFSCVRVTRDAGNFPFICSNIPAAPSYGAYISQMIQYSRACGSYQDFLDRGLLLTRKLLNQGFLFSKVEIITSNMLRHHDLVDRYGTSVSQMTTDMFHLSQTLPGPFLIHDLLPGL